MPKYVEIDELSEERKEEAWLEYMRVENFQPEEYPLEMFIREARENWWQFSKD